MLSLCQTTGLTGQCINSVVVWHESVKAGKYYCSEPQPCFQDVVECFGLRWSRSESPHQVEPPTWRGLTPAHRFLSTQEKVWVCMKVCVFRANLFSCGVKGFPLIWVSVTQPSRSMWGPALDIRDFEYNQWQGLCDNWGAETQARWVTWLLTWSVSSLAPTFQNLQMHIDKVFFFFSSSAI